MEERRYHREERREDGIIQRGLKRWNFITFDERKPRGKQGVRGREMEGKRLERGVERQREGRE